MTHFRLKPEVVVQQWLTPHSAIPEYKPQIPVLLAKDGWKPEVDYTGHDYAQMKAYAPYYDQAFFGPKKDFIISETSNLR